MTSQEQIVAGYFPVIHRGYVDLIDKYPTATIGVFDDSILSEFDYLRKDIRALTPEAAAAALTGFDRKTSLLSRTALLHTLRSADIQLIMPHDDISRTLVDMYPAVRTEVILEPIFLRWDRDNTSVNVDVKPDREVNAREFSSIITTVENEANYSANWWRHVGAAIIIEGTVVASAHNQSLPTDFSLYIDGDPRITSHRGKDIETSIDIHAESKLIAEMAKQGISLQDTEICVSTFPCPNCAKLIATSGIKTCYFIEGYAMLDGHSVLKAANVEVVKITGAQLSTDAASQTIAYKSS